MILIDWNNLYLDKTFINYISNNKITLRKSFIKFYLGSHDFSEFNYKKYDYKNNNLWYLSQIFELSHFKTSQLYCLKKYFIILSFIKERNENILILNLPKIYKNDLKSRFPFKPLNFKGQDLSKLKIKLYKYSPFFCRLFFGYFMF